MLNNDEAFPREDMEILWASIEMCDTPLWRLQAALLAFGRYNVPETRDSYNPIKRAAAVVGCRIQDRLLAQAQAIGQARAKEDA